MVLRRRLAIFLAAVLLLWAFALWTTRLTAPFIGRHDNNTAWLTISARNYLRYGYFTLGFLHTYDVDPLKPTPEIFYNSTPPLPAMMVSFGIVLFGDFESSSRIIPMFMTMLGGAALYTLVRDKLGRGLALLALLLFMTTPMIAFYGQMVAPEEFTVPFFLLLLLSYQRYLRQPSRKWFWIILICAALTSLSGWASVFALAGVCLHALFFAPNRIRLISAIAITVVVSHLSWLLAGSAVMPGFWERLLNRFLSRSGITSSNVTWNSFFDFIVQLWWTRMRIRFTEALFVLAGIGGLWVWLTRKTQSPRQRQMGLFTAMLFFPALCYLLAFQEATWVHDYFTYYFAPGLAILAALAIVFLYRQFLERNTWQGRAAGILLLLLLVGLVVSTVRWTRALYMEQETFPVEIGSQVLSHVPAGAPLYTNAPFWPAAWYYSQRDFKSLADLEEEAPSEADIMRCEQNSQNPPPEAVKAGSWTCVFARRSAVG